MSLFLPLDVFCERGLCRLRVCFAISVPMLTVCECICVCSCTLLMKSDFLRKKRYILSVHLYFFYATDLRFRFRLASGQRINAAGSRYSQVQQVRLCCVYVCVILRALDSSTALSSSVQLNKLQLLSLCSGGTPQQPAHLQVITMLSPTSPTSSINTHGANTAHPWEEEEGGREKNSWSEQNVLPQHLCTGLDRLLLCGFCWNLVRLSDFAMFLLALAYVVQPR